MLLFLYRDVLARELSGLQGTIRAKRPDRLPLVLSRDEVSAILNHLHGHSDVSTTMIYTHVLNRADSG